MKLYGTLCMWIFMVFSNLFSQTVLQPGDVTVIGVNCDNPDDFAFLLMRDIDTGTEIRFTDNGWLAAGGFRGGEGIQIYTAPFQIPAGTVLVFSEVAGNFTSSGTFALSSSGDQLLVYQGDESTPSLIYAVNIFGAAVWQDDATSSNASALPAGLINGETAVALQEFDNVIYSGSLNFPTPAQARLAISNPANWLGDDLNRFELGLIGDFSLPVKLSSFTSSSGDGIVVLSWSTESETDNMGFEILRSLEQDSGYVTLAGYRDYPSLRGQGNTNVRTVYRFEDRSVRNDMLYWYQLVDVDMNGQRTFHGPLSATPHAAGGEVVNRGAGDYPVTFELFQNYPNPFNPSTRIEFDIPERLGTDLEIRLSVSDLLGRELKILYSGAMAAGRYRVEWDGTDDSGKSMPAGIYFANLRAGYFSRTIRMVLQK